MKFKVHTPNVEETFDVTPHTTVKEVLDRLCLQFQLNKEEYILTYKSKALDNSLKLFHSGLEEGTVLSIENAESFQKPITSLLYIDFLCFFGTFDLSDNVWTVVTALCPEDSLENSLYTVTIQGQLELRGEHKMKEMLLSSLVDPSEPSNKLVFRLNMKESKSKPAYKKKPGEIKKVVPPKKTDPKNENAIKKHSVAKSVENIEYLGERRALIFSPPNQVHNNQDDVSDDFFELTEEEAKRIYTDLIKQNKKMEEQPFMTRHLKEINEMERMQNLLNKYKHSIIRIYFPDRYILQGVFQPLDTIKTVMQFVKGYLRNPAIDFYLYTAPPKRELDPEKSLIDLHCVPAAKLYFGVKNMDIRQTSFLQEGFMERVTSFDTANEDIVSLKEKDSGATIASEVHPLIPARSVQPGPSNEISETEVPKVNIRKTSKEKIPKWFKHP